MTDMTPRLSLPLLAAGQAQKEVFHNEALATLDALVQPCVQSFGDVAPPGAPLVGESWIVGTAPTGDWSGHAGALATWTEGGWRFAAPFEGMTAWIAGTALPARYTSGNWIVGEIRGSALLVGGQQVVGARLPAIAAPGGGSVIDAEARTAISALIVALRTHGLTSV